MEKKPAAKWKYPEKEKNKSLWKVLDELQTQPPPVKRKKKDEEEFDDNESIDVPQMTTGQF